MADPIVGTEVDGYRIEEVLGRGGMGVVYKAEDVALSRNVALKRIEPSLANDEAFLRRFRSEARALARVDSTYIVTVHALRRTDVGLLIVMEYVDGGTLNDRLGEGPMDWEEALPIIKQMLKALEHAHGAEVIHRDVKPHNIMLTEGGTVKVTDFGLAKVHRPDSNETVTQGVYGTLNYMSPEQVQGDSALDHRSDLYSLGMTMYEMLAGDLPFDDDASEFDKMRAIVEDAFPRPDEFGPAVPDRLADLVMRSLEKDPDDRFQSAETMRQALEAFEANQAEDEVPAASGNEQAPSKATSSTASWGRVAGVAATLALLGLGGYFVMNPAGNGASSAAGGQQDGGASPPPTRLTVATDPGGADIYRGDQLLGTAPLTHEVTGDSIALHVERADYEPVDTTLRVNGANDSVAIALSERAEGPPVAEANPSNAEDNSELQQTPGENGDTNDAEAETDSAPPAQGSVTFESAPSGTVLVDGETRPVGESIRLSEGTHEVEFRYEEYAKDTTITVAPNTSEKITCYFRHQVSVQSTGPWVSVYLNGEDTGEDTDWNTTLPPGTHDVEARPSQLRGTVEGGTYRWRVGDERHSETFSGNAKTLTLEPSFKQQVHIVDFRVTESGSR